MKTFIILTAALLFTSCNVNTGCRTVTAEKTSFTIANWNVQTFFDGVTEGTEYSSFKSAKYWSNEKYSTRLKRLCEVLNTLNADIYTLEEIENEGVLQDIANQFAGKAWDSKTNWTYACFSKEKGAAIGCAVLSKYPLFGLKTHALDIMTESQTQPSMRPLIEVSADVNGREIILFVNHWKSKSGGEEKSEVWRNWQEKVLQVRLDSVFNNANPACIVSGDFNRDIDEFNENFKSHSPWLNSEGEYSSNMGSYYYKGEWERIDHIFNFGSAEIESFCACAQSPWITELGTPFSYTIYTGEGYSDHLPVMATVKVN